MRLYLNAYKPKSNEETTGHPRVSTSVGRAGKYTELKRLFANGVGCEDLKGELPVTMVNDNSPLLRCWCWEPSDWRLSDVFSATSRCRSISIDPLVVIQLHTPYRRQNILCWLTLVTLAKYQKHHDLQAQPRIRANVRPTAIVSTLAITTIAEIHRPHPIALADHTKIPPTPSRNTPIFTSEGPIG